MSYQYRQGSQEYSYRNGSLSEGTPILVGVRSYSSTRASSYDPNDLAYRDKRKTRCVVASTITASFLALLLCGKTLLSPSPLDLPPAVPATDGQETNKHYNPNQNPSEPTSKMVKKLYDNLGRFIVEDFDTKPTFSDFLSGVAGIYGKPMWSFYVNRGQGIASFGVESKDFPFMEFNSANKAYQNTALLGFRTFIQGTRATHSFLSEPFSNTRTRFSVGTSQESIQSMLPKRFMYVGHNEMQIRETDLMNKLETNVTYFVLPEEDFGALVRRTTIKNLDSQEPLTISVLDGLARMEPAGGKLNSALKNIGRTLEGFMGVYQSHEDTLTMPFYRMSEEPADTASVKIEARGHYCLAFVEKSSGEYSPLVPIVYDTSKVFGEDTMLLHPVMLGTKSIADIISEPQYGFATTSSAFAAADSITLQPGGSATITSFYGRVDNIMDVPVIARRITATGFVQYKQSRAREIGDQITMGVETKTANEAFNMHVAQMYMDNSLRGGIPIILGEEDDQASYSNADEDDRLKVVHLFSRIHGDLERDYNDFVLEPTFFSQGPGNFRDVAQNRRNDVFFTPRIGSFNVKMFLSYIQADGYEPLSVEGAVFTIDNKEVCDSIASKAVGYGDGHRAQQEGLSNILCAGPFRLGQMFSLMEEQRIDLIISRQTFVDLVAAASELNPMAVYGDGYWADHWTYYMDLIQNYLAIYPDWEELIMFDESLPYFFSPVFVKPRSEKYVLSVKFGGVGFHVRQLEATIKDEVKIVEQQKILKNAAGSYDLQYHWKHANTGGIFKSSPISKLFLLGAIKFATRDAYGMGIEYEGGKPGWNDAMNGLVGMVGSGMPETYELNVLLEYVQSTIKKYKHPLIVPFELNDLIDSVDLALDELDMSGYKDESVLETVVPEALFVYWDTVSSAREAYRDKVRDEFSGRTIELPPKLVDQMISRWIQQIKLGQARAMVIGTHGDGDNSTSGITPTYFSFDVSKWNKTGMANSEGLPLVFPTEMTVGTFPLFLEGPVRMMKSVNAKEALAIYQNVRESGLRDEGLSMYTISASLSGQSYDMGRMMAFTPGWLENQSVWMHMSYKFYLEMLRSGLYGNFFDEMRSGGMLPFMRPDVYGRSILECSSFIVSSTFSDPKMQGRGVLARLSGSTAEFLSMWTLMMIGENPFFVDPRTKELRMQLIPVLPLWMFESEDVKTPSNDKVEQTLSFKLFSSISVTYHNTMKRDLFKVPPYRYEVVLRDGTTLTIYGASIPYDTAEKIRRVIFVDSIDAYFH